MKFIILSKGLYQLSEFITDYELLVAIICYFFAFYQVIKADI
jgi:hypothetical protein